MNRQGAAALLVAVAAVTGVAATSGTAQAAASKTYSCSAGGFTGYVWFSYVKQAGRSTFIQEIRYRIDKGSQRGGNEANVSWHDGGTLPATNYATANGIQDNQYHRMGGGYYRGGGSLGAKFVFDKSNAGDPECTIPMPNP